MHCFALATWLVRVTFDGRPAVADACLCAACTQHVAHACSLRPALAHSAVVADMCSHLDCCRYYTCITTLSACRCRVCQRVWQRALSRRWQQGYPSHMAPPPSLPSKALHRRRCRGHRRQMPPTPPCEDAAVVAAPAAVPRLLLQRLAWRDSSALKW